MPHSVWRSLRSRPAFAVTAIGALALGIGLSTAVFTVGDAMLLRRLPIRDQDGVVVLWGKKPNEAFAYPLSATGSREFAQRTRTLSRVSSFAYEEATPVLIRDGDRVSRLKRTLVAGDFFATLDAPPVLGRTLRASDDVWGADRVMVLSYTAWQRRFGRDTTIVGRRMSMHEDGASYTIVGVMPRGLDFPAGTDFWAALHASILPSSLQYAAANLIGRLAPGATPENAADELTAYFTRPGAEEWSRHLRGVSATLVARTLGDTRAALFAVAAASALLLLIACLNVANLLLVRGLARGREMAVRAALGAERRDLVRQLLGENAVIALAAGVLGTLVAMATVQLFIAFAPSSIPRLAEIHVRASMLGSALAISVISLLLFGLAPALDASRANLHDVLRSDARLTANRRSRRTTEVLVAGQIALALMVLFAAGLIGRSLIKLSRADLSFDGSHLVIAELALQYNQLDDTRKQRAAIDEVVSQLARMPEVSAVSPVVAAPFAGTGGWDGQPAREGQSEKDAARNPMLNMEVVAPAYFETFGMAVLRGRAFVDADREGALPVVIVSRSTAEYFWPGADAIGKRLTMGRGKDRTFTIVGVVADTRYRDLREARASIYFPLRQAFFPFTATTLAIRARTSPAAAIQALERVVGTNTPGIALASAAPFAAFVDKPLGQPRLNALLLAVFAASCIALSAIGLFAVMSTMVRQRRRELGIRMAVGATPANVRHMILARGLAITGSGSAAGLIGGLLANRLLTTLLYGVPPTDPVILVGVTGLVVIVTALATLLPALAGGRVSVVNALRADS